MRKDQIFVLLLIVMLPMSGCFDDAVGEAEGAENDSTDDSSTTTVRNIVKTLHIADGQTHVITLNGSTTLQIMDIYGVNEDGYWRTATNLAFKMGPIVFAYKDLLRFLLKPCPSHNLAATLPP